MDGNIQRGPGIPAPTMMTMMEEGLKAAGAKVFVFDVGASYKRFTLQLDWLQRALFSTSPEPCGEFKQAWTMKLLRSGSRCQLPRGFVKGKPMFVGGPSHMRSQVQH